MIYEIFQSINLFTSGYALRGLAFSTFLELQTEELEINIFFRQADQNIIGNDQTTSIYNNIYLNI